jgi:WD domain, G-beta repeat
MRFATLLLVFAVTPLIAAPPVTSLAYRDGQLLAAGTHGVVTLIDPATGDRIATLPEQKGRITALAFSKNGTLAVASGESGKTGLVRLYNLAVGQALHTKPTAEFTAHRDAIYTLAFSPDGNTLASAGYDRVIKLWNLAKTDEPKLVLLDHSDAVYSVAFHPNGKLLASGSADRAVKIWDVATGNRLYTLSDPIEWVYAVAWSPDGKKLAAGGVDKSIRIWEATADAGKLVNSVFAHTRGVTQLIYTADSQTLISVGEDATVKIWDAGKMVETKVFAKQPELVHAMVLRPDGKQLAIGRFDGTGVFVDPATGTNGGVFLPSKPKPPTISKISPDSGVRGQTIRVILEGQRLDTATAIQSTGITAKILSVSPTLLEAELSIAANAAVGANPILAKSADGTSPSVNFIVDRFVPIPEKGNTDSARSAMMVTLPTTILGSIDRAGDIDYFAFQAKAGEQVGVHVVTTNGKLDPKLSLTDAEGSSLAESESNMLGYVIPKAGRYAIAIRDKEYRGNAEMTYRLHIGDVPVVTTVFPLAVSKGKEIDVHVDGVNLGEAKPMRLKVPMDAVVGSRIAVPLGGASVIVGEFPSTIVTEFGTELRSLPATADGILAKPGETQTIKFRAKTGDRLLIETHARRLGSPLDSSIEILDATGKPVPRVTLRCVAKTDITFRDHDSSTSGIRIENWNELAMNDYLFSGTELMRINELPKGPDDDCQFASRAGQRLGYLGTTPTYHYMGKTLFKVEIHPPSSSFSPNGMPIFKLGYRNDDGGPGYGKDSLLFFDAPADGSYQVRVSDSRGFGGPNFAYRLTVRPPRPDFTLDANPKSPSVWKGSGIAITVSTNRADGYEGPIAIKVLGWPAPPTFIEAEQTSTTFTLFAEDGTPPPTSELILEGTATINGKEVKRTVSLGKPSLVEPGELATTVSTETIAIQPGKETKFKVSVERRKQFQGRVPIEVRGLPYGVRVLNIGLNGILLTERDTEREVALYAEPWVKPMTHPFTVLAKREGTSKEFAAKPMILTVK